MRAGGIRAGEIPGRTIRALPREGAARKEARGNPRGVPRRGVRRGVSKGGSKEEEVKLYALHVARQ